MLKDSITVHAPSLDKALQIASEKLSVPIKDLSYQIVQKPKLSFFSLDKNYVVKIWQSSFLGTILNQSIKENLDIEETSLSMSPEQENQGDIYDEPIVIVKDNGIFVKLNKDTVYSEHMLKRAFEKRGVLKELEAQISEILVMLPQEFTKVSDFKGKITDKSELILSFNIDKTQAFLKMKKPKKKGAPTCSYEEIVSFLKGQGITYGFMFGNILDLAQKEILDTPIIVAMGKPAVAEHSISYHKYYLPQYIQPIIDDKTNIDFKKSITKYHSFKRGDLICEKLGRTPFMPGIDVFGQTIDTALETDDKNTILMAGEHITLSEDGLKFYAQIDGFIIEKDDILSMSHFLHIKEDIGYHTGNINAMGDIIISGNIKPGFQVQSTGNITIDGFVQKGTIISDKDIRVKKGIIRGNILAKGSLICHYIEFSKVYTGGNIICKQEVNQCYVQCAGYLLIYGPKATLVGGDIFIKKGVISKKIGSELQGINMTIGLDPMIIDIHDKISVERDLLLKKQPKLQFLLDKINKTSQKTLLIQEDKEKLTINIQDNQKLIHKLEEELVKIEQYFEQKHSNGFISFSSYLYAGVKLNLNNMDVPIQDNIFQKTIRVENHRLIVSNYETSELEKEILSLYKI